MKSSFWRAEEAYPYPPNMTREEVLAKFHFCLEGLGWKHYETGVGYAATTPFTLRSTGETVEVEIGQSEIFLKSSGGSSILALSSRSVHRSNLETLMDAFRLQSTIAPVFNHEEFFEKTGKAFALLRAGVLDEQEFQATKSRALTNLDKRTLAMPATQFLMGIVPLVDSGAVTREELESIKKRIL